MIGILMLDTAFPRYLGDVGNPETFESPVKYAVVPGATPDAVVCGDVLPWVDAFIAAGQDLVAAGCTGLITTCGFLTPLRDRVAQQTGVPVVSSALELIPALITSGRRPGILTISAKSLTEQHLVAADVPFDTPIQGVDGGHFATAILSNQNVLRWDESEQELVVGARALVDATPNIDVIVLECTNMPPHAAAIASATGCEVVSILTAIETF
ncbi:MAG: aspartate/glutamate racemase family protein [Pseudomonadota bacterium]